MTLEDVRKRVEEIRALDGDPEMLHVAEDQLREDLLRALADGTLETPQSCAALALTTNPFGEGRRWCA